MNRRLTGVLVLAALLGVQIQARAEDLKVLSAGALEPAMIALADGFRRQTGNAVRVEFGTTTEIRERGKSALTVELVAAPDTLISELATLKRVMAMPVAIGRVGLGVVVRTGSTLPDISTPQALRAALIAAKSVVYNRASSGQGIESLISKLGLTEQLAAKTVRFPDAESVMRHMMTDGDGAIGFGAPTAISLYTGSRLRYVGSVPTELQSYTRYAVAVTPAASSLAQQFIDYIATPNARELIKTAGVD